MGVNLPPCATESDNINKIKNLLGPLKMCCCSIAVPAVLQYYCASVLLCCSATLLQCYCATMLWCSSAMMLQCNSASELYTAVPYGATMLLC